MIGLESDLQGKEVSAGAAAGAEPVPGYELMAAAIRAQGFDTAFFVMGGPLTEFAGACLRQDVRMIDARHEQGAALMAQAFARVKGGAALCMACSGPGTTNLASGLVNAFVDGVPVVAIGGSSPVSSYQKQAFQEIDQVAIMRPITKWAVRVHDVRRFPEYLEQAQRHALSGKPGPVYLDVPGDVVFEKVARDEIEALVAARRPQSIHRAAPADAAIREVLDMLGRAERPVVVSGGGIIWSHAGAALRDFVDHAGIPYFPTPQGRGAVPDDHAMCFPNARSLAFKQADVVLVIGTRINYMLSFGDVPRFAPDAQFIHVDIDPEEISRDKRPGLLVQSDARAFLERLVAAWNSRADRYRAWTERLQGLEAERQAEREELAGSDAEPIHPLRLCAELSRILDRDAVLVVDGQEILNYGRQAMKTYVLGHRLNSGPFGMMGVGVPFGVGAKAALPDTQVVVLTGDGAFGMNGIEVDVSVRHDLPILIVISLNGGWTADPDGRKAGSRLGYPRYERIGEVFGCHAEYVERIEELSPALERARQAVAGGRTTIVNVRTDPAARAQTTRFSKYRT